MIELFKDRHKLSLILAGFFFFAVFITAFYAYSLPHSSMPVKGNSMLAPFYFWFALTFLSGTLAIWNALNNRKEFIIYREQQLSDLTPETHLPESVVGTISLAEVKNSFDQAHDGKEILETGLQMVCKQLHAVQGAGYLIVDDGQKKKAVLKCGYALTISNVSFDIGEGLIGQTAANGKTVYLEDVPGDYIPVVSGLGSASPKYLLIVPFKNQNQVTGMLEIASFTPIMGDERKFVEASAQLIADKIS